MGNNHLSLKKQELIKDCRYKADVRYEVDPEVHQYQRPEAESPNLALYVPQKVEVNQIPVTQYVPRQKVQYQYVPEEVPVSVSTTQIYLA